jgi:hypothetical protein
MIKKVVTVTTQPAGDGWICEVEVSEAGTSSRHAVRVSKKQLERLGGQSPEDLVMRSFAFLLEREPKESILTEFDLDLIGRYFPDYPDRIKRS